MGSARDRCPRSVSMRVIASQDLVYVVIVPRINQELAIFANIFKSSLLLQPTQGHSQVKRILQFI